MKKSISKLLISALAVVTLSTFAVGCSSKDSADNGKSETKKVEMEVVKTTSNTHEVSLEKGKWTDFNENVPGAVLKKQNASSNQCIIISEESKTAFADNATAKDYANLTVEVLKKTTEGVTASELKELQINGKQAVQFEANATVNKMKLKYLITVIADDKTFSKISLWTTEDNYDKSKESFTNITNSFK